MEKETKKMPYHLTITDNETGETVRDLDFDALIGAVHLSKKESGGIFLANCSIMAQAETIASAEATVARALKQDKLVAMAKCIVDAEVVEEDSETEGTETKEG